MRICRIISCVSARHNCDMGRIDNQRRGSTDGLRRSSLTALRRAYPTASCTFRAVNILGYLLTAVAVKTINSGTRGQHFYSQSRRRKPVLRGDGRFLRYVRASIARYLARVINRLQVKPGFEYIPFFLNKFIASLFYHHASARCLLTTGSTDARFLLEADGR